MTSAMLLVVAALAIIGARAAHTRGAEGRTSAWIALAGATGAAGVYAFFVELLWGHLL